MSDIDYEMIGAWVDDLRSDKFKQTNGLLKNTDSETGEVSFCCLGVLQERVCPEKTCVSDVELSGDIRKFDCFWDNQGEIKPEYKEECVEYLEGFGYDFQNNDRIGRRLGLAAMNDDLDMSFSQIADFIETKTSTIIPGFDMSYWDRRKLEG